jgi:hypothetical protein
VKIARALYADGRGEFGGAIRCPGEPFGKVKVSLRFMTHEVLMEGNLLVARGESKFVVKGRDQDGDFTLNPLQSHLPGSRNL